jgi:hypothetical protein
LEDQAAGGCGFLTGIQAGHPRVRGDRLPHGAFNETEDQQRQADHGDQGLDAPVGLEEVAAPEEQVFEAMLDGWTRCAPFARI